MRKRLWTVCSRALHRFLLALVLACPPVAGDWLPSGLSGIQPAYADDDGGDDDGGDDGGSSGGRSGASGSGRSTGGWGPRGGSILKLFGGRSKPRAHRRAKAPVQRRAQSSVSQPPVQPRDEIIGFGFSAAELGQLSAAGFVILERQPLLAFGTEVLKLRIPPGRTLDTARQQANALAPQAAIDLNHYYRPNGEESCGSTDCLARIVVGWPAGEQGERSCTAAVNIGLIDTGVNADHATFAGGDIETIRLGDATARESGKQHGTAVAALLVGSATGRAPGLVPGGTLIAVDAFDPAGRQGDRSDAFVLVRALDLLARRGVHVINLSLSGPANTVLEKAVDRVADRGIVLVAAAGNGGPRSKPSYPAAYEQVLAVTAIDRSKRPYRRAGRGEHIDLAAPGVAVWTVASKSGARPKTGTSFAAPFVTAAAALLKAQNPGLSPEQVHERLTGSAEDLGDPGKDPIFGWGLLNARAICDVAP